MGKKKSGSRAITPEKARARHDAEIRGAAAIAGLPEAQRDPQLLELKRVPQIAQEATPITHTVRKLTRIERLQRAGTLEPHQAAACEWYAGRYELGYSAGLGVTANYEGASGGGAHEFDLCAKYEAQMIARDDYVWARSIIEPMYRELFDAIIIQQDGITTVASAMFEQKRSRAEEKTRAALRLCADQLFDAVKAFLPIDAPVKLAANDAHGTSAPTNAPAGRTRKPISEAIDLKLDEAFFAGITVAEIHLAESTAEALEGEGHKERFRELRIVVRKDWRAWAIMLAPEPQAHAA